MGLRDRQQGDRQQIVMRVGRRRKFRGLDPTGQTLIPVRSPENPLEGDHPQQQRDPDGFDA
jgi:hypothetical protein